MHIINSDPMPMPTLTGLPPIIDKRVQVLILGSFPGGASLAARQYYAHPRNQFWRLLSAVLDDDVAALPYADRLPRLLQHRVGLWDVLGACDRAGSLDSAIRNPHANDFDMLRTECPQLQRFQRQGVGQSRAVVRRGRLRHVDSALLLAGKRSMEFRAQTGRMARYHPYHPFALTAAFAP